MFEIVSGKASNFFLRNFLGTTKGVACNDHKIVKKIVDANDDDQIMTAWYICTLWSVRGIKASHFYSYYICQFS